MLQINNEVKKGSEMLQRVGVDVLAWDAWKSLLQEETYEESPEQS